MNVKRSWLEIEHAVYRSRLQQFQHSFFVPSNFTFYKNLLIFLGVPPAGDTFTNENTLIYVDIDGGSWEHANIDQLNKKGSEQITDAYSSFHWNLLLDPQIPLSSFSNSAYSKEEEILRERKRVVSHGITSYEFDEESGKLLFRSGNDLIHVDVSSVAVGNSKFASSSAISSNLFGSKMDAKICPSNSNIISFIDNGDIWIGNIVTGSEMRLTFVRNNGREDAVSAGVPSHVMQEEFERYTGYWWEPRRQRDMEGSLEVHRILYELVDERKVEELQISSAPDQNYCTYVENYRYPKAGSFNAKSSLQLVEFCVKSSTNEFLDGSIVEYELRVDLKEVFPWIEYIVRCGWMPDGKHIWVQVFNRIQNQTAILRIPCAAFRPVALNVTWASDNFRQHKFDVLLEESSNYWINISNVFEFLPSDRSDKISFIWLSEQTNFKHLYHYVVSTESSGDGYFGGGNRFFSSDSFCECIIRKCCVLKKTVLTRGNWEVDSEKVWLDIKNDLIYFMGTKDTPIEKHLYCVSTSGGYIHKLTKSGYSHNVTLSKDCSHAVVISSSISSLHQINLCKILQNPYNNSGRITLNGIGWLETPKELPSTYTKPEMFQYTNAKGYQIYGMLFKPVNWKAGTKYPTMLYVYGGPGVQLVSNSQRSVRRLNLYSLTSLGYAVVMMDTMGSCNRGLEFEAELKNNMGCVEIEQQIEGLRYISNKSGIIDMDRIVIHGWSYGGYLALMGLCQRPDIFKVAIAGAPVTSWELYDTGYTERYMNLPSTNKENYRKSSVLRYVDQFPSEPNRLLIVHGLVDENVHFSHTNSLIAELVNKGKPYQLQVYPSERHGIRSSSSAKHYETYVVWFIQQYFRYMNG